MGFFDKFFSRKEEVQPEVEIVEEIERPEKYNAIGTCDYCNQDIKDNEKLKEISKVLFHKRCFKKYQKQVANFARGQ